MNLYGLLETMISKLNKSVKTEAQTLTDTEKSQARENINVPSKNEVCNPNLLDNWYFGNPVNQRGKTSYTAAGYTIDRWKATGAPSVAVNDGYLTFAATTNSARLMQPMEFPATGTLTLSALAKSTGVAGSLSLRTNGTQTVLQHRSIPISSTYQLVTFTFKVEESDIINGLGAVFSGDAGASVDILAVKLEIGDTQTLAHQDADGNWVLNEIPKYSEQLAECQRYYQVIPFRSNYSTPVATGSRYSATHTRIPLIFPQDFRITPTMTIDSTLSLKVLGGGQSGTTIAHSDIAISSVVKNKVTLHIGNENLALVSGYPTLLYGNGVEGGGIQGIRFSADL